LVEASGLLKEWRTVASLHRYGADAERMVDTLYLAALVREQFVYRAEMKSIDRHLRPAA